MSGPFCSAVLLHIHTFPSSTDLLHPCTMTSVMCLLFNLHNKLYILYYNFDVNLGWKVFYGSSLFSVFNNL